jgi:hypothetical protein
MPEDFPDLAFFMGATWCLPLCGRSPHWKDVVANAPLVENCDLPDDKILNIALITSMLVRGSGEIESVATVPAVTAEDAVPYVQQAQ